MSRVNPKTYLFHGPSGCGKDTQVEELTKLYPNRFESIGTGDMFRNLYKEGVADAVKAHGYYSTGQFVPDKLTYKLLEKWLSNYDKGKDWIFVSVVRTFEQVTMFDKLLSKFDRRLDAFIHFSLDAETAIERMSPRTICPKCGATYHPVFKPEKTKGICDKDGEELIHREDDYPDSIRKRLAQYVETIDPILQTYKKRKLLIEIDAAPSIKEIHKVVVTKLENI